MTYAETLFTAFTRAKTEPIRCYRLLHDRLHCQMGFSVTLADIAEDKWRLDHAGIPTTIVEDWLDLRPEPMPLPQPPQKRRRTPRLRLVRSQVRSGQGASGRGAGGTGA
jgi:hypothetical protein